MSDRDARLVYLGAPKLPDGMVYELRYKTLHDNVAGMTVVVFDEEGHEQGDMQVFRMDSMDELFIQDLVASCTRAANSAMRAVRVRNRLREWADES